MLLLANVTATICFGMMARTSHVGHANLPASPALISPTAPHAILLATDYSTPPPISLMFRVSSVSVYIDITLLPSIKIVCPVTIPVKYALLVQEMIVCCVRLKLNDF
jgi:hypothetical protein